VIQETRNRARGRINSDEKFPVSISVSILTVACNQVSRKRAVASAHYVEHSLFNRASAAVAALLAPATNTTWSAPFPAIAASAAGFGPSPMPIA
jgi:hypothetical protein